jgi:hypothetical protein
VRQESAADLDPLLFLWCFADGGRVLRQWIRKRGSSLQLIGLVTERECTDPAAAPAQPLGEHLTEDEDSIG